MTVSASWSPEIIRGADPTAVAAIAAREIARSIQDAIAARGIASLMLAGGTTPRLVHAALAEDATIPWERVRLFVGDERAVPASSPDSNARMIQETLLEKARVPLSSVFLPDGAAADLEAEAERYAALLPLEIDLLLLGMGEDGHTASLFPGASSLAEVTRRVMVIQGPKPPPTRLTITPLVLQFARRTFVFATGIGKAAALRRALDSFEPSALPVQLTTRVTLFVDAPALPSTKESP